MDAGLRGSVAIVTGAGSGIGLAVTRQLADEGAHVVAGDRDPSATRAIDGVVPVRVDFGDPESGSLLVRTAIYEFGSVDVVVNNFGVSEHREGVCSISDEDWVESFDLNFLTAVRTSRAALPTMTARRRGALVHIASEAARTGDPYSTDYNVSKAALLILSKAIANEFGPYGIRSNTVSPGPTRTPAWDDFGAALAERYELPFDDALDHHVREVRKIPLGRMADPEDVASTVVFLASDLARHVTGSDYRVDGGAPTSV